MTMSTQVLTKYKQLLAHFLSFQTVSTLDSSQEVDKAVAWLKSLFVNQDFQCEVIRGYDNPVIIASKIINPKLPTVLIYGHYDVQPASMEEWGTNPFRLRETDSRLFGRGVVDNKGQMLVHLVNVFDLLEQNKLAYNIKFLVEGNEETGSPNIGKFIEKYKKQLDADFILISDSAMIQNHPTIELSLRGTFNTTLTIRTSDTDLHSGLFGGAAPSAVHVAAKLIAKLFVDETTIAYKDFYKKVTKPADELQNLALSIPMTARQYKKLTGCSAMTLESDQNFFSQTGLRPTIQVTGFESGYTGKGYRNSIPAEAIIKFNFRLVPDQDPDEVLTEFKKFVKSVLPKYVKHEFSVPERTEGSVKPIRLSAQNKYIEQAKRIMKEIYQDDVYYDFNGATLPIVVDFKRILQTDIVMAALANDDCNMHAVDENFDLQSLQKALQFSSKFLSTNP